MSLIKLNLNLKDMNYPFLSKESGGGAFFNQEGSYLILPRISHISNLWPANASTLKAVISKPASHITSLSGANLAAASGSVIANIVKIISGVSSSYGLITRHAIYTLDYDTWREVISIPGNEQITVALLKQATFFHITNLGTYLIPEASTADFGTVEQPIFVGIDSYKMLAVCAANSYLIFVDKDTVYWSSPRNPLYFDPNGTLNNYGAGSSKVLSIKASINFCIASENSFYIFTDDSVIYAESTGNVDNPWAFDIVRNAAGCDVIEYVNIDSKTGTLFYWSKSGLASISKTQVTYIFPDCTEMLGGSIYEEYDDITAHKKVKSATPIIYEPRVRFLSNRYLTISYRSSEEIYFTDAILFDTLLQKWFHLKVNHIDMFPLLEDNTEGALTFWDWTQTFDDTDTLTFEDMLPTAKNTQEQAVRIGYIAVSGTFNSLSPIKEDIDLVTEGEFTFLTGTVLPNQLQFDDVRLSRSGNTQLQVVELTNTYESYSENSQFFDVATAIYVQSKENPTPIEFSVANISAEISTYSGRIGGERFTLSLENINSLNTITLYMDSVGVTFK